ncbi:hypothetical protein TNIN_484041 [Trichonephila inaurata madagascariensis]|uniref:Uncharacterized protein n=1 Tax=Trichonephila inaurata madagascariensis TaxID=2747483 RepID=A0A8X7CI52_9ARAC|nr:hypothetical protein TNIN_484041 [Trichonephila inaurata madagascariensis]
MVQRILTACQRIYGWYVEKCENNVHRAVEEDQSSFVLKYIESQSEMRWVFESLLIRYTFRVEHMCVGLQWHSMTGVKLFVSNEDKKALLLKHACHGSDFPPH